MKKLLFLFFTIIVFSFSSQAKHLVGGDLQYTCLGKDAQGFNLYQITLNVYKDCLPTDDFPTNTPFDTEIILYVYNALDNSSVGNLTISLTSSENLPLTGSDTCVAPPTNLCYAIGSYTTIARLPDNPSGYDIVWGRCCRNETIQNILLPGESGILVNTRIPNTDLCNNSPQFRNLLPTYICRNDLFSFDHSAIDADGDELTYSIVTPYTAGSQTDPVPVVVPPYIPIAWLPGYGLNNIMDGSPSLSVDANTGILNVRPQNLGQYVFSLRVTERRNGQVIGVIQRDIQVNVIDCPINFPPDIQLPDNNFVSGDTLLFERDVETCFSVIISDQNGPGIAPDSLSFRFDGPHLALPDPGSIQVQSLGIDSLLVNVCWSPDCDFMDFDQNYLIFTVEDQYDCPAPNVIRDTIYFKSIRPIVPVPSLNCVQRLMANELEIDWIPLTPEEQNGFSAFIIYRDDGNGFQEIDRIFDPTANSYTDATVVDPDNINYCYQLAVVKECPELEIGPRSLSICSELTTGNGICAVSVGTAGIELNWPANQSGAFEAYRIYKEINGSLNLVEEISDPNITSWTDASVIEPGVSVCYELGVLNGCSSELLTGVHCSIPIQAEDNDEEIRIDWGEYEGWTEGVIRYVVWRRANGLEEIIGNLPATAPLQWVDTDISFDQGGQYCYRIQAIPADLDSCRLESWSAEKCVSFDPNVFAATAFTPNGDGINDVFELKGSFFSRVQLRIFNRWGREIYSSSSLDQSWDGSMKGSPAPEGVYVYLLEYEDFEGKVFRKSGSITLLR